MCSWVSQPGASSSATRCRACMRAQSLAGASIDARRGDRRLTWLLAKGPGGMGSVHSPTSTWSTPASRASLGACAVPGRWSACRCWAWSESSRTGANTCSPSSCIEGESFAASKEAVAARHEEIFGWLKVDHGSRRPGVGAALLAVKRPVAVTTRSRPIADPATRRRPEMPSVELRRLFVPPGHPA
jgi:hypothetical protein